MSKLDSLSNAQVPQIVLYSVQPQQRNISCLMPKPDTFHKQKKEENQVIIDSNDTFTPSREKFESNEFADNQMLGAKFNPEKAKKCGQEVWKWGKRVLTGLEVYDTFDGYRDRFTNNESV